MPQGVAAHQGDDWIAPPSDGRIPGIADVTKAGGATYRFKPAEKSYEVRRPGQPPYSLHADSLPSIPAGRPSFAAAPGPGISLPSQELAPVCRTKGHRIVVVYTHRAGDKTPTPTATLRSIVRRINWKVASQSSLGSSGKRVVNLFVDCNGEGAISVYDVVTSDNNFPTVDSAVRKALFGGPTFNNSIKYLVFEHYANEENSSIAGLAGIFDDALKDDENENAKLTNSAVVYGNVWERHVAIHELFHTLGAAQGGVEPRAPNSTLGHHCTDGIDMLCYLDESLYSLSYNEKSCPASGGYETPENVPIDCGKDTYFNGTPEAGTWLAEHWDVAGLEDPFVAAIPKVKTEPASAIKATSTRINAAVWAEGSTPFYHFEYGKTTSYGTSIPAPDSEATGGNPTLVFRDLSGLSPETTYHYRIVAHNEVGEAAPGEDKTFTTGPSPLTLAENATAVSYNGATLNGKVNPEGVASTYRFEYGTTTAYGTSVPVPDKSAGSGTAFVKQSETISGLNPATTYHFRIVAENSLGKVSNGADKTFQTAKPPPAVTTEAATGVTSKAATLRGAVNPKGLATSYRFEYGTTTSYGTSVPVPDKALGSGESAIEVSDAISGLSAGTTYHFRVVATNSSGTSPGEDKTFTTPSKPTATTEPAADTSSFEPQLNAVINPGGASTSYHFEYDTAEYKEGEGAHGTKIPIPDESVGSGTTDVSVGKILKGLAKNTTYHFRVVAENEAGTSVGKDRSFTTLPACKGAEGKCSWSTQTTVAPTVRTEQQLKDVSCSSSTKCMAVGYDDYTDRGFAESWNGTKWQIEGGIANSNPSIAVSCVSSGICMVLDESGGTRGTRRFGAGTSFYAFATPSGVTDWGMRDISCSSESACTAVGWTYDKGANKYKSLIERWNGSAWSIQSGAGSSEENGYESLLSVSCPTSTFCMAAGLGAGTGKPFAEKWNGSEWTATSISAPSVSRFTSVSCSSSSACMAVGHSGYVGFTETEPIAESWNGSNWSVVETPEPSEEVFSEKEIFTGVSCLSASSCTVVGHYFTKEGEAGNEERTLAESWDGSELTVQASPNPKPFSAFSAVYCTASTQCTAVGSARPNQGSAENQVTLGERWE